MRPPYSNYAAPPIYVYPAPQQRGVHFSRIELFQLGVAVLALSAAFTLATVSPVYGSLAGFSLSTLALLFVASLVAVGTGVGLHEVMHKIVAQRYGLWAEFRYSPRGLLMTFLFAFVGFVFGAPGATYISGVVTMDQNGKISAAGPVTNVLLGVGFLGVEVAALVAGSSPVAFIAFYAASINLILAGFNMIPVMPLDGAKVWHWNKGAWVGLVGLIVAILAAGALYGLAFL